MRLPICIICFIYIVTFTGSGVASEVSRYLLSISDVVLVGTITVAPKFIADSAPIPSSDPQPSLSFGFARIKIDKVLKGIYTDSQSPLISLRIPMVASLSKQPSLSERIAPYTKGTQVIMFLQDSRLKMEQPEESFNDEAVHLVAFDQFFSVLPYSEPLELEITKQK